MSCNISDLSSISAFNFPKIELLELDRNNWTFENLINMLNKMDRNNYPRLKKISLKGPRL